MVKITKMWAVLSDEEGIAAMFDNGMWLPMISADDAIAKKMAANAQELADATGLCFQLVEFSVRKDVELIEPANKGKIH